MEIILEQAAKHNDVFIIEKILITFKKQLGVCVLSNTLCTAARHGKTEAVKCLLKYGAAIHFNPPQTPLVLATKGGNLDTVSELLKLGATDFDNVAIMTCIESCHDEISKLLITHGASNYSADNWKALLCKAVDEDNEVIVRFILDRAKDVITPELLTLVLEEAFSYRYRFCTTMAELLIEQGADINFIYQQSKDHPKLPKYQAIIIDSVVCYKITFKKLKFMLEHNVHFVGAIKLVYDIIKTHPPSIPFYDREDAYTIFKYLVEERGEDITQLDI